MVVTQELLNINGIALQGQREIRELMNDIMLSINYLFVITYYN